MNTLLKMIRQSMDVTRHNFKELWPEIEEAINSASFFAIDGEFTGLYIQGYIYIVLLFLAKTGSSLLVLLMFTPHCFLINFRMSVVAFPLGNVNNERKEVKGT